MEREIDNIMAISFREKRIEVKFKNAGKLTRKVAEPLRRSLMDYITCNGYELVINLNGIVFIDNSIIDSFNLLSRMAHRYNSKVILNHVSIEVFEMINLIRKYSVFDIKEVVPARVSQVAA